MGGGESREDAIKRADREQWIRQQKEIEAAQACRQAEEAARQAREAARQAEIARQTEQYELRAQMRRLADKAEANEHVRQIEEQLRRIQIESKLAAIENEKQAREIERRRRIEEEMRERQIREEEERANEEERLRKEAEQKLKEIQMKEQMKKEEAEDLDEKVRKLREKVAEMKPGDTMPYFDETDFPKKLLVGIYGTSGIGKTSLMNSIKYSVEGGIDRNVWFQAAAVEFQGGHTMRRRKLPMTKHLWFVDTRGFVTEDLENDDALKELINQLEGRGSFAREVVWTGRDFEQDKKAKVKEHNRIFCTILVFSAKNVETIRPVIKKFVRILFKWQGRYPLAVITHAESATPEEVNKARFLLLSSGLSDIYEVENVNETDKDKPKHDLEPKYQLVLLKLLERCMVDGDAIFQMRYEIDEENISQEDSVNNETVSTPEENPEKDES